MAKSHREAVRLLFEFAEQQQGFFTTKQAKAAGFAENLPTDHLLSRMGRIFSASERRALSDDSDQTDHLLSTYQFAALVISALSWVVDGCRQPYLPHCAVAGISVGYLVVGRVYYM
jgi:hypothetical protein